MQRKACVPELLRLKPYRPPGHRLFLQELRSGGTIRKQLSAEEQNAAAHGKQQGQTDDADGVPAGHLRKGGHQEGANHSGKFAENVEETKVFVGTLRGNQFSEIGPGNGLDAALHGAHQKGHAPEENQGKLQRLLAAWILFNVEAHKKAH